MRNILVSCMLLCVALKVNAQADSAVLWKEKDIKVCWINPTDANQPEREIVKRAIKKTWEAASALTFSGWCACDSFRRGKENGIRILIASDTPKVYSIGHDITYDSIGMRLRFDFSSGLQLPVYSTKYKRMQKEMEFGRDEAQLIFPTGEDRKLFIEAVAVHEFGHALGYVHEQVNNCHYGTDCRFPEYPPVKKSILSATCNERSVMNYCNDVYLNEGYLSYFDRTLLQKYYGTKEETSTAAAPIEIDYKNLKWIVTQRVHQQQSQRAPVNPKIKTKRQKIRIQLKGDKSLLQDITMVEYFFHRNTFDPITVQHDKKGKYRILLRKVWGNFSCEAVVHLKNGESFIVPSYIISQPKLIRKAGWDLNIFRDPGNKSANF